MIGHIFDLLYQRPEQEQELLSQLVNKLGDPVKKIASKVVFFLLKLCEWPCYVLNVLPSILEVCQPNNFSITISFEVGVSGVQKAFTWLQAQSKPHPPLMPLHAIPHPSTYLTLGVPLLRLFVHI